MDHGFDLDGLNVLIPEAFRFDKGNHALEWAALDLFDALCKDIQHVPDSAMPDWMALRTLIENRDTPEWNYQISSLVEKTIPFVRNGPHRKHLSSMLELWADHDIVDISVNHRHNRVAGFD